MHKEVISEYYLERYAMRELPDDEAEEIGWMVSTDPELQAALNEIESSNREILALYPPRMVTASLSTQIAAPSENASTATKEKLTEKISAEHTEEPSETLPEKPKETLPEKPSAMPLETPAEMPSKKWKRAFPLRPILAVSSVAAILLAVLLILPLLKQKPGIVHRGEEEDITLIKGIPRVDLSVTQLLVYRKIEDKVEILSDGDKASAGDLLQLAYVATEETDETHGMILSVDGRGLITLHYPESKDKSTQLELNKQLSLPNAIELDDAPGFERFFFLTSGSPIDVKAVLITLKNSVRDPEHVKTTNLDLPESLKQYSILILKGAGS